MNAQPHATAHAPATALAHATFARSVDAKGREGKGREGTGPNGVFSSWSTSIHSSSYVPASRATSGITQPTTNPTHLPLEGATHAERFWLKVKWAPGDSCWEWMGEKNQKGYGRFYLDGRRIGAHRVAYELLNGPIPDGLQGGHLCHNTSCVRPDHIAAVTAMENVRQRDERMKRVPGAALTSTERNRKSRQERRDLLAELHLLRKSVATVLELAASAEKTGDAIWPHEIRDAAAMPTAWMALRRNEDAR